MRVTVRVAVASNSSLRRIRVGDLLEVFPRAG